MEESKKKNLSVRALSSVIFVLVMATAVLVSPYTFLALLVVVCIGAMSEFYKLAGAKGAEPQKIYGIVFGALIITASFMMFFTSALWPRLYLTGGLLMLFLPLAAELYRKKDNPIVNIAVTLAGVLYVAVPLALLVAISAMPLGCFSEVSMPGYHPWVVLIYFAIIWMNDVGAYLVGVSLGKHRLFERISPKKSWEGFFGGLAFGILTAVAFALIFGLDIWLWIGMAAVAVVAGVFGDLVESMFKRAAGVKDSGQIMPGHGGYLDRFDSMFYSLPFVFAYFIIFA